MGKYLHFCLMSCDTAAALPLLETLTNFGNKFCSLSGGSGGPSYESFSMLAKVSRSGFLWPLAVEGIKKLVWVSVTIPTVLGLSECLDTVHENLTSNGSSGEDISF